MLLLLLLNLRPKCKAANKMVLTSAGLTNPSRTTTGRSTGGGSSPGLHPRSPFLPGFPSLFRVSDLSLFSPTQMLRQSASQPGIFRRNMHPEDRNRPATAGLFGANPARSRNAECISPFWRIGRGKRLGEPFLFSGTYRYPEAIRPRPKGQLGETSASSVESVPLSSLFT